MITTLIGKTFLEKYNKEFQKSLSPKEFFETVYFELFFNHAKYMQWVTNSPFVQMKKGQKPNTLTIEERVEKLQNLNEKVESGLADASFAIGYPASELKEFASTSGLVSDLDLAISEKDIYCSWIGSGLGIGIAGGYTLLINDSEILWQTYLGWEHYRTYLNDPALKKIRGNQINSWNGQWLTYKLGKTYRNDFNFRDLHLEGIFKVDQNLVEVNTVNWSNLFFSLSRLYPNKTVNAYVYSLGQTNKTIGFIPFHLKSGNNLIHVFKQLYQSEEPFETRKFQALFGMHIKRACELGNIGLHALRPDSLKKYMYEQKKITFKKEEDFINYQSYKTWLVAMLSKNKEEVKDYTLEIAQLIQRYRAGARGTERKTLIEKELFGETSKRIFLNALSKMVKEIEESDIDTLKGLKEAVHLMTNEEFAYFNTLLKFDYAFVERKS